MLALANVDPFATYDVLRERGPVVWDPGMKCWLVLSYDICRVDESDESIYRIVPADLPEWMIHIRGGETWSFDSDRGEARAHASCLSQDVQFCAHAALPRQLRSSRHALQHRPLRQ